MPKAARQSAQAQSLTIDPVTRARLQEAAIMRLRWHTWSPASSARIDRPHRSPASIACIDHLHRSTERQTVQKSHSTILNLRAFQEKTC